MRSVVDAYKHAVDIVEMAWCRSLLLRSVLKSSPQRSQSKQRARLQLYRDTELVDPG